MPTEEKPYSNWADLFQTSCSRCM